MKVHAIKSELSVFHMIKNYTVEFEFDRSCSGHVFIGLLYVQVTCLLCLFCMFRSRVYYDCFACSGRMCLFGDEDCSGSHFNATIGSIQQPYCCRNSDNIEFVMYNASDPDYVGCRCANNTAPLTPPGAYNVPLTQRYVSSGESCANYYWTVVCSRHVVLDRCPPDCHWVFSVWIFVFAEKREKALCVSLCV